MADVYGSIYATGSTKFITAHQMKLFVGDGKQPTLVQNINISYSQPTQTIREIGSKKYYIAAQPTQGMMSIGRLVSEKGSLLKELPSQDGSIWWSDSVKYPDITLKQLDGDLEYRLHGCMATNFGTNINSEAPHIQENLQISFFSMEVFNKTTVLGA